MTAPRVGIDIVEVDEVDDSLAHFGARYLTRVFSEAELVSAGDMAPEEVAARFAAKEAAIKVIGDVEPLDWRSVEILSAPDGRQLHLTGRAAESARELGLSQWSITTSVTERYAMAVAFAAVES